MISSRRMREMTPDHQVLAPIALSTDGAPQSGTLDAIKAATGYVSPDIKRNPESANDPEGNALLAIAALCLARAKAIFSRSTDKEPLS
jgi:hypothetical protein